MRTLIFIFAVLLVVSSSAQATPPGSGTSIETWNDDHSADMIDEPADDPDTESLPEGLWLVSCTGTLTMCEKRAEASCPSGFDVVGDTYSENGFRLTRAVKCR